MSVTVASTPAADGFRMPGEFTARTRAVGWPGPSAGTSGGCRRGPRRRRSRRWRRRSTPVSPSRWGSPTACSRAAARCWRPRCGSSSCPRDDAWMRDAGPTFVLDGRGRRRGVDWHFNAWGGLQGGLYHPVGPRRTRRRQGARGRAGRPLPGAAGARGRLDPLRRRGHRPDDRRVPAEPEPQPGAGTGGDRAAAARVPRRRAGRCGSGAGSPRTRPTATSTTSPASSRPAACC